MLPDRLPRAQHRPLSTTLDEPTIEAKCLLFHTMVGYLKPTEAMFKRGGYDGTESTFGLGGSWDGADLDGVLWQWNSMRRQSDAQWDGNDYALSCECSDGGSINSPFTSKQLDTLIGLVVDLVHLAGWPCEIVAKPGDKGFGYHAQFDVWNHAHHSCPGPVRIGQIRTVVIPKARAILTGTPTPKPKPKPVPAHHDHGRIDVDGVFAAATIGAVQHVLKIKVDGIFGPATRKAFQHHLRVTADGIVGTNTVKALQRHLTKVGGYKGEVDGIWGKFTTMALQRALNAGKF